MPTQSLTEAQSDELHTILNGLGHCEALLQAGHDVALVATKLEAVSAKLARFIVFNSER